MPRSPRTRSSAALKRTIPKANAIEIATSSALHAMSGPAVPGAHSGHCPIAIPIPMGIASSSKSRISPTIARFLTTVRSYHGALNWEMESTSLAPRGS